MEWLLSESCSREESSILSMEEIQSVSVYKDIGALLGDKSEKKKDIFDPNHVRTPDKDKVSHSLPTLFSHAFAVLCGSPARECREGRCRRRRRRGRHGDTRSGST